MMILTMMNLSLGLVCALFHLLWKFCWFFQSRRLWRFFSHWNHVNWWRFTVGSVCTKRSQVQILSTHRIILAPKILNFTLSFKTPYKIIVVLYFCLAPAIRCIFTNITPRKDTVGAIRWHSFSGGGDKDRTHFIHCIDWRHPEINELWTFGEDGVTPKVYPTARRPKFFMFTAHNSPIAMQPFWTLRNTS